MTNADCGITIFARESLPHTTMRSIFALVVVKSVCTLYTQSNSVDNTPAQAESEQISNKPSSTGEDGGDKVVTCVHFRYVVETSRKKEEDEGHER